MMAGKLITFEGGDGSGKTTQLERLYTSLNRLGVAYVHFREPGDTAWGEGIREVLLQPRQESIGDFAELCLFLSARSQLVKERVRPLLAAGMDVFLDRYIDSSVAYQGYGRGIDVDLVKRLNHEATGGLIPDLTLLYDIDPEIGIERARRKKRDRIEEAGPEMHRRVRQGYLDLARSEPRFRVLDGHKGVVELHQETLRVVLEMIGSYSESS
jgi:dTMP kinase